MTEHELQNALISWLKLQGCYPIRLNSGKVQNALTGSWLELAPAGTPDIVTSRLDKTMGFVEVKSKTGTLSMDQITQLRAIDALGLTWCVADDLEDVDKWLHDAAYHGKAKHTDAVRDRFAYSKTPYRKKSTLTSSQMMEFELWSRKHKP